MLLAIVAAGVYVAARAAPVMVEIRTLIDVDAPKVQHTMADVTSFLRQARPLLPRAEAVLNRTTTLLCRIPFISPPLPFCAQRYGGAVG